ncbi:MULTISPECIES: hypothetical protein [unclassified Streptomyces]|uniref:hypothetical protein n=1 Tax=unclassified Streptomyces TaxID=2593676 RepID=UPI002E1204D6|nr:MULTISPECIES: hypothetical protein [unclassified Streptomyces]WSR27769.1 hypothetical protein OG573_17490 [Streptomyces sp. NBC_01205]
MSARRPLLTALGATSLLAALWFVPSANATAPGSAAPGSTTSGSTSDAAPESANTSGPGAVTGLAEDPADTTAAGAQSAGQVSLGLADTGGIDTTPYLLGGTLCLGLGAGFVTYSVRRSRA